MRRCASLVATRQISWSDQGTSELGPLRGFWGRPVRTLTHPGQNCKGQHHQADVPVPAVPGAGFLVSEPEFGLVSNASSIAQWRPSTLTRVWIGVPAGHQVVK